MAIPVERPPVSVDIFRSSMFQAEPSEAAEKQGANWMKWILIGAGPVVLALVLLIVFSRSSSSNVAALRMPRHQPSLLLRRRQSRKTRPQAIA